MARMEEGRNAFKMLTGKPTGKRPLERPMLRWKDNIRIDLIEIGINARNWVDSSLDWNYWRDFGNSALNLWVSHAMELVNVKTECQLFVFRADC